MLGAFPRRRKKIPELVLNRRHVAAFPLYHLIQREIRDMPTLAIAILLAQQAASADVPRPFFVATSPERASGFSSLAECDRALTGRDGVLGTQFNRAAGNTSRCELVFGEAVVVVYPKGLDNAPRR